MYLVFAAESQTRKYYLGGLPQEPGSWTWHKERAQALDAKASRLLVLALWDARILGGRNVVTPN